MVQEVGSFAKGSKNLMTQTSTPKFVEVVVEVMQVDKVVELFKTIAIVSLDMGYLTFGGEQFEE
jgi:hypothetical protein